MALRNIRTNFTYIFLSILLFATLYHHFLTDTISFSPPSLSSFSSSNNAVFDNLSSVALPPLPTILDDTTAIAVPPSISVAEPPKTSVPEQHEINPIPKPISTTSILIPAWEVLVIVSPETHLPNSTEGYVCLFDTNEISPARFSGVLPSPDRATFTCLLPTRARRRLPFKQPVLLKPSQNHNSASADHPLLLRWSYLVYDSLTTDHDVVLFVKGVNPRQGINRNPGEFRCVFGDNGVRTNVTQSMQEVFRCQKPDVTAFGGEGGGKPLKVSLEIVTENRVVPSVAYYTPQRKLASEGGKRLMCATTMVYEVAKFLREWVVYYSKIGVERFLLYDNGSDDDLGNVVDELVKEGFDISTYFWVWPKTQEAGFSHSAIYARDACSWMVYADVDEFVYSPTWNMLPQPSKSLLHSLVQSDSQNLLGQVSIDCLEFGPSGQKIHPPAGVIQGYNCRRANFNRHKSILLLDAVNDSLLNVIHHFELKPNYESRLLNKRDVVVNHYKYQAWPEFKTKFRRRVSAYVLDWTDKLNPASNDRTPGLGFEPVEPEGWPEKFCEVRDNGLKDLTLKWFGKKSNSGYLMPWRR